MADSALILSLALFLFMAPMTMANNKQPTTVCSEKCCNCTDTLVSCSDCQSLTIGETAAGRPTPLPNSAHRVVLSRIGVLKIAVGAVAKLPRLLFLRLDNVADVQFESRSLVSQVSLMSESFPLAGPRIIINQPRTAQFQVDIVNCTIKTIPNMTFSGNAYSSIRISHSRLGSVSGDSLTQMPNLRSLWLTDNMIDTIEPFAVSSSTTQQLNMERNTIQTMRSNGVNASVVQNLDLAHNTIGEMQTECLVLNKPANLAVRNNTIRLLYRHAFNFSVSQRVDIEDNSIRHVHRHALHYIRPLDATLAHSRFTLRKNIISMLDPDALFIEYFPAYKVQIADLMLDVDCSCHLRFLLLTNRSAGGDLRAARESDDDSVDNLMYMSATCRTERNNQTSLYQFSQSCRNPKPTPPTPAPTTKPAEKQWLSAGVGGGVVALVIMLLAAAGGCCWRRRRRSKKAARMIQQLQLARIREQSADNVSNGNSMPRNWLVAVPDTMLVYKETEFQECVPMRNSQYDDNF